MSRPFASFRSVARTVRHSLAALAFVLLAGAQAFAQTPAAPSRPFAAPSVTTSPAPSGIASLGQVTVALGLVLAVIFVAAWLLRRVRGLGKTGTGVLDVIADLPVGQKERAVLIRVGTTQVLIGVAPGRVTTLHVLTEPVSATPPVAAGGTGGLTGTDRPTFKSLLLKGLGK
ncbi:MAG: flagellar biosynthetic protein FliO [Gammaproteobacteria bacterium]